MKINDIRKEIKNIKRTTFGISLPELRKFAKKIAKEDYKEFLDKNKNETFELKLLHGYVLGYAKDDIDVLLKYFDDFIPYVGDWAVCDTFCQSFKITKKYRDTVWDYLMQYKKSQKEFESRVVSVMLLSHFLTDEYIDKVIKVLDRLSTNDYYSQMGVAWAVATAMAYYPDKCMDYLKSDKCHLDKITFKKTLQKIRESFRVSDDIKKELRSYFSQK